MGGSALKTMQVSRRLVLSQGLGVPGWEPMVDCVRGSWGKARGKHLLDTKGGKCDQAAKNSQGGQRRKWTGVTGFPFKDGSPEKVRQKTLSCCVVVGPTQTSPGL